MANNVVNLTKKVTRTVHTNVPPVTTTGGGGGTPPTTGQLWPRITQA